MLVLLLKWSMQQFLAVFYYSFDDVSFWNLFCSDVFAVKGLGSQWLKSMSMSLW